MIASAIFGTGVLSRAETLRVVSWNVDADNPAPDGTYNGLTYGGSNSGIPYASSQLETVLEAVGAEKPVNSTNTFDVLALEELYATSATQFNSTTLNSIVTNLNTKYGSGTYAYDTTADGTSGDVDSGGGPSGLIYDTKTIQIISVEAIGNATNGSEARQPLRYTLQPIGYPSTAQFYLYVQHAKSGSGSAAERNTEMQGVRTDANALGANAHLIYTGDYNFFAGSSEAGYSTLTNNPGSGEAIDPGTFNLADEDESAQGVSYRDELQLFNAATQSQNGVQYVAGSYNVFGNNGSTASNKPVNLGTNTALSDLSNGATVLDDLTKVTDHLPVEADYLISGITAPEPMMVGLLPIGAMLLRRRGRAQVSV